MKNIILSTGLALILILGTSCNKWLDLQPRDGITKQEFWKTKEDVAAAVAGCYNSLLAPPPGINDRSLLEYFFVHGELRGDMISPGIGMSVDELNILNVNITADNNFARWAAYYRTINYCNTVIDSAPAVKGTDPTFTDVQLNAFVAEALTLRSLMYFYLVRIYGDVPLKLKATFKDSDLQELGKTKQADILKQIVVDLKIAEQGAVTSYGNNRFDKARVTKFTVNSLLADVYLWMEDYPSALAECNKVIDSQRFALVNANSSWYNNVFFIGASTETVFEFDQAIENPFFNLLVISRRRYVGSPNLVTDVFVPDDLDPNNIDIRSQSFYNSFFTITKYGTQSPSFVKWQAYRISDVMLMKAEALALTGAGAEALAIVENIRLRRQALASTQVMVDPTDIEALCDYILAERAREFAFEGKRWFDLLRHAKRDNYKRLDILLDMVSKTVDPSLQQSAINKFRDKNSHYLPIHEQELFADTKLVQNPFYIK